MARAEFLTRKQGTRDNISNYIEHKFVLFHSAYEDHNEANYAALLTASINGMPNPVVKRMVRRHNPTTENDLRTLAILAVANEREAYLSGYGESTSLDGVAAVTITSSGKAIIFLKLRIWT